MSERRAKKKEKESERDGGLKCKSIMIFLQNKRHELWIKLRF